MSSSSSSSSSLLLNDQDASNVVENRSKVRFQYTIRAKEGKEEYDSGKVEIQVGLGQIKEDIENGLMGMKAGESKEIESVKERVMNGVNIEDEEAEQEVVVVCLVVENVVGWQQFEERIPSGLEGKLEAGETIKGKGNQLFGKKEYREAVMVYERALKMTKLAKERHTEELNENKELKERFAKLRVSLLNNCNTCLGNFDKGDYTGLGKDPKKVVEQQMMKNCNEALALDPKSVKALYRRGQLFNGKGEYEKALKDLETAVGLKPRDSNIKFEFNLAKGEVDSGSFEVDLSAL